MKLGPFVDSTDGATAETALTIANTDIRLSANGGNLVAKNIGGGTHDEAGWYTITLDATDTATVGRLQLHCKMAGALMVHHEYQVIEETVYDALIGASAAGELAVKLSAQGKLDVNAEADTAITDAALATAAALAMVDGNVDAILLDTGTDGVVVAAASKTGYSLSSAGIQGVWDALTSALITAGSVGKLIVDNINATISSRMATTHIAATAGKVDGVALVDTTTTNTDMRGTDGANTVTPPTAAAIADAVLDEALSGHVAAGSLGKAVADTETDAAAILLDTGTDGVVVAAGSKTGYSLTAATGLGNQTANITGNLSGSVGSVTGAVGSVTGAVGSVTGNVGGNVTGSVGSLAAQAKADVATAALTTQMTESYAANGVAPTLAQATFAIHQGLFQFGIAGTSLTVRKLDDTTTAFVVTLDSASAPTDAKRV